MDGSQVLLPPTRLSDRKEEGGNLRKRKQDGRVPVLLPPMRGTEVAVCREAVAARVGGKLV